MRIKLGIKTWSTLGGMLFSLVMITGCNEETPPANPAPAGGKMEPKKDGMAPTTPPPPATDKAKEPGK